MGTAVARCPPFATRAKPRTLCQVLPVASSSAVPLAAVVAGALLLLVWLFREANRGGVEAARREDQLMAESVDQAIRERRYQAARERAYAGTDGVSKAPEQTQAVQTHAVGAWPATASAAEDAVPALALSGAGRSSPSLQSPDPQTAPIPTLAAAATRRPVFAATARAQATGDATVPLPPPAIRPPGDLSDAGVARAPFPPSRTPGEGPERPDDSSAVPLPPPAPGPRESVGSESFSTVPLPPPGPASEPPPEPSEVETTGTPPSGPLAQPAPEPASFAEAPSPEAAWPTPEPVGNEESVPYVALLAALAGLTVALVVIRRRRRRRRRA
jgi:hypothetical protein